VIPCPHSRARHDERGRHDERDDAENGGDGDELLSTHAASL
jgi:hypothetical protein